MAYKELLEGIADENLRKQLDEEISRLAKESGERGRKLIEKDAELSGLKTSSKQTSEWQTYFKMLKDEGFDAKDIPAILDTLKVQKSAADEAKLMATMVKELQGKLKAAETQVKGFEIKTAMDSVFSEVRKNFKNEKGEVLTVVDDFIDMGKLYSDVSDPTNKVLLEQRATEVLKDGFQKQEGIKAKFGFVGAPTHQVVEGSPNPGGDNNIAARLKEISQKSGPVAAFSEMLKLEKGA